VAIISIEDIESGNAGPRAAWAGGTLVATAGGLLHLDEITSDGLNAPRSGDPLRHRVALESGLDVLADCLARVPVLTEDGPSWRSVGDLAVGDPLSVKLGWLRGSPQSLDHIPVKMHHNQHMARFPSQLDSDLAFLLGYLAGNGFVGHSPGDFRLGASIPWGSALIEDLPVLIQRLFGDIHISTQQKPGDRSLTVVIANRSVREFLAGNGLDKNRAAEVEVPAAVRRSSPEVVGAFLRGLFEADGAVSHGYPQLSSVSEKLIRQVAGLLLGLGCPVRVWCSVGGKGHLGTLPLWIVRIEGHRGLAAWSARIGCDPQSRFMACVAHRPDGNRESVDELPFAAWWLRPVLDATLVRQFDKQGRGDGIYGHSTDPLLRRKLLRYMRTRPDKSDMRGATDERRFAMSAYTALSAAHPDFERHARHVGDTWYSRVATIENGLEAPSA
jgi:ribonucleoside-diphosphate reductase alpha chain